MSHEIEQFGDLAAFVSHRELPWHQLGTVTEDVLTAESALELAHLNGWDVRKSPATTVVNGQTLAMPGRFAVIRNNPFENKIDVLGDVGNQYAPVQNEDHAEFLNTLVDESHAHFETAGSLKDGREVFITMKAPETILIGGVDPVDTYIAAHNTHDGSKSFRVITTPVRVVCANTLSAAFRNATNMVAIRHTAGHGGAVARAREALGVTFKYMDTFQEEAEKMIQQTITNAKFDKIMAELYPINEAKMSDLQQNRAHEHRANVRSLFDASPTSTEIRGTNWAGYQAVTEYLDYFVNVPGAQGEAEVTARAEKAIDDKKTEALKRQAFQLLSV